jgi:hypothetical protein
MAKNTAIRFLLLATMRMEKLYQLSLFRRMSVKESRLDCDWRYRIRHSHFPRVPLWPGNWKRPRSLEALPCKAHAALLTITNRSSCTS